LQKFVSSGAPLFVLTRYPILDMSKVTGVFLLTVLTVSNPEFCKKEYKIKV